MSALRRDTLALLNADGREYDVVLTSGATGALRLVAEAFPWTPGASTLAHPPAVHNSVLGMRGPALAAGAAVQLVHLAHAAAAAGEAAAAGLERGAGAAADGVADGQRCCGDPTRAVAQGPPMVSPAYEAAAAAATATVTRNAGAAGGGGPTAHASGPGPEDGVPYDVPYHLLALPAECNFTGDREPLAHVVRHVHQHGLKYDSTSAAATSSAGDAEGIRSGGAGQWLVLLDAAKACSTAPPDLSAVPADFVVLSYYKIFGHPTGLGALVARKGALQLLSRHKAYWGGGTVEVAVADRPYQVRRPGHAGLEDGTPAFTAAAAARHGFAFLSRLGGPRAVHAHACGLARWLAERLAGLRHANGAPVAVLYGRWPAAIAAARNEASASSAGRAAGGAACPAEKGAKAPGNGATGAHAVHRTAHAGAVRAATNDSGSDSDVRTDDYASADEATASDTDGLGRGHRGELEGEDQERAPLHGPTLAFNLQRSDGSWVGHAEVARLAALHGLHVRSGCFCNPGACAQWLGLSAEEAIEHHRAGHVCWDDRDVMDGKPTGAVRASFGAASSLRDAAALLALVRRYWLDSGSPTPTFADPTSAPASTDTDPTSAAASAAAAAAAPASPAAEAAAAGVGCGSAAGAGQLAGIWLYPVKSCAPQRVAAWPVGPTGLLADREWALVDDGGKVLTLKHCPRMALLRPELDLAAATLTFNAPHDARVPPLVLRVPRSSLGLEEPGAAGAAQEEGQGDGGSVRQAAADGAVQSVRLDAGLRLERVQVCGDTVCSDVVDACALGAAGGEEGVRRWFAAVLGAPCRIVQQRPGARRVRRPGTHLTKRGGGGEEDGGGGGGGEAPGGGPQAGAAVGFANDGQYLLVTQASLVDLRSRLASDSAGSGTDHTGTGSSTAGGGEAQAGPRTRGGAHGAQGPDGEDLLTRLRPNLVVEGPWLPYAEDGWRGVRVGALAAEVLGACPRCELLQVDPRSGLRGGSEVLRALAQYRRSRTGGGRVQFGVLLAGQGRGEGGEVVVEGEMEGEEAEGQGPVEVGSPEWLRRRFGRSVVLEVGDPVLPSASA
ncbi:hypothetical protein HYH03_010212 [Edaphochlamys debaryana]|uniref:MOSC domain-containing protein n=1 Tax=Edaphochlamys debaryana TaxID=47281 RepID=A0A836BXQ1_9CHLO|nr:hypothetical protein HYH03_010212 [Edaphochlamys debaryana]|eukprot:KAG2491424.1 hypothetical protein HYH03_010212 [Edaphochlamys debaryana]